MKGTKMNDIINVSFEGLEQDFTKDGFINATKAASHFNKLCKDYLRLDRTREYVNAMRRSLPSKQNQLVIVQHGGSNPGTWIHPKLVIDFARWLNPKFAVWVESNQLRILEEGEKRMKRSNIIALNYEGINYNFTDDGYIHATEAAKHFGKICRDYLKSERTQEYVKALCVKIQINQNQLVTVKAGGGNVGGGTWIHPKLAIDFARWLNPGFAVWCDEQIEKILSGNTIVNIQDDYENDNLLHQMIQLKNQAQLSIKMRKIQLDQERKIKLLEQDVNNFKYIAEEADKNLKQLPEATVDAKEKTTRAALNEIVRLYAISRSIPYGKVWGNLYRELYSRESYNVKVRWKKGKYLYKNKLEMIEDDDYLEELYAIAKETLD
jgi:hypothetical protein